jgi:hypothetical protein
VTQIKAKKRDLKALDKGLTSKLDEPSEKRKEALYLAELVLKSADMQPRVPLKSTPTGELEEKESS